MSQAGVTRERIVALPKAELHVHLEGGRALGCAEDFESATLALLESLSAQGVVYAEPRVSAGEQAHRGLDLVRVVRAVLAGAERAERSLGIRTGVVVDLVRDRGPERGFEWVRSLAPLREEGLVGLGLGGSEERVPAGRFSEVFREARRLGFRLTAHAGERAGPESVREALDGLGVERIGHGVRAAEDPALMAELARRRVPLEVCPGANLRAGVVPSIAEHPVRRLLAAGVRVALSCDDPTLHQTSLVEEYLVLNRELGFGWDELVELAAEGLRSSFAPLADRQQMLAELHRSSGSRGWARPGP